MLDNVLHLYSVLTIRVKLLAYLYTGRSFMPCYGRALGVP